MNSSSYLVKILNCANHFIGGLDERRSFPTSIAFVTVVITELTTVLSAIQATSYGYIMAVAPPYVYGTVRTPGHVYLFTLPNMTRYQIHKILRVKTYLVVRILVMQAASILFVFVAMSDPNTPWLGWACTYSG